MIISSDLQKKSEQVFKDGDDERATKFAEELKNHVNKRKWNYLLEPIVYGAKQEYSRILRLFTYFEIIWFIFWGLCFGSFAIYDVVTGEESIVLWIVVWCVEMGIICGPVYLIQFLGAEKVRGILEKQQIRSSYCNTGTTAKRINKEFDLLKMYLTEKEFLDEIGDIQRRINAERREDERLDEKHIEEVKDFCEKFTEMWIAKFLR